MTRDKERSKEFIAYFTQRFPALRTTFIRREVEALRGLGVSLEVISMRRADETEIKGDGEAEAHLATTHYLPNSPLSFLCIWSNLMTCLAQPITYLGLWRLAWADPGGPGLIRRMRLLLQIWRGALVARMLARIGSCRHIHAQFADGAATTALVASKLMGVPFSFMSHTSHDSPALREKIRAARFIASISHFDKQQLLSRSEPGADSRIHIIHCGIPIDNWPYRARQECHPPARIISTGALCEKKGHDVLIEACALLMSSGLDFQCEIIGGGSLHGDLQRLIERHGLQTCVKLLGPRPQCEVRNKLYAADLFVLACKKTGTNDIDGIPVSLMEAMAVGVPVVSTSISGIPELIPDGLGRLVRPEDPQALADAICTTIQNYDDRKVLEARRWVESNFNQILEAKKLRDLLGS